MSPADARLAELVAPVEEGVAAMREVVLDALRTETPAVSEMTAHIGRFRGKQLRGTLVLLAAAATGNRDEELPRVAAIVELIHLATLVHDDVLDGAEKRRRVASVNRRWDNQTAVLLGDFLYARAFHLSTTLGVRLASRLLAVTTQEICAGEIEQASGRWDFEMGQAHYERIAMAKTGALYGAACELGARYPGRGPEDPVGVALREFGRDLGLAFQIVDDVLDLVGDPESVGKGVGTDVSDGKVSLPVLHTYATADDATRARIRDAYTLPDLDDEPGGRLARLRAVCDLEPGVAYARQRAADLVARARGRVASLARGPDDRGDGRARVALDALGDYVLARRW